MKNSAQRKNRLVLFACIPLMLIGTGVQAQTTLKSDIRYKTTVGTVNLYRSFIENQKRIESEEEELENPYHPTERDFKIALPLIEKGLRQCGFCKVSDAEFSSRIKAVFGVDISNANSRSPYVFRTKVRSEYVTLFVESMDKTVETLDFMEYDLPFFSHNIFISPKWQLVTEMPLLENLITVTGLNEYAINVDNDWFRLIIHLNKYLFNDNQESYKYLLEHSFWIQKLKDIFKYETTHIK